MNEQKRKISLSEQAYRRLRDLITTLELKPGSQINESELERELSIGRTPVREALLRLVNERFLTSVPGRGFFVSEVTVAGVKSLFEAVMILERGGIALAARRISKADIDHMEDVNRTLRAAMEKREFLEITLLNSQFHRIIHEASHNDFLISSLNNSESQYHRLAYLCFSEEAEPNDLKAHFDKVIADHKQLIECLKNRDEQAAVDTITRHIRLFHARVSQYLFPPVQALYATQGAYLMSA